MNIYFFAQRRCLMLLILLLSVLLGDHLFAQRRSPSRSNAKPPARVMYSNPVLAGDFPDPSVIRVGQDYYATATSSEWEPEFPIMHSRDLVNWRVVGAVFKQRPAWSIGNYWASEIAEDNGRFYIYYTARRQPQNGEKEGRLCVAVATANQPQGPYTDRGALVCQDAGSIDGFPIRDENGKRYLVWKYDGNSQQKPTPIYAQPLTEDGTRLIGEMTELMTNTEAWEAQLIEGAAIVRRNGYFYMFYSGNACCGLGCNYAMGIARSKTLLGKWEKYNQNPILKSNQAWKCPGHGTLVTTPDGRDFMLYHAYHMQDSVYVGRQALLDEVTWTQDGWAQINNRRGASSRARSPFGAIERNAEYRFFDDFKQSVLRPGWQWQQNNEPEIKLHRGSLRLAPSARHPQPADVLAAMVGYWTTTGDYHATTALDVRDLPPNSHAGIAAVGDAENALGLAVRGNRQLVLWKREKNNHQVIDERNVPFDGEKLYLKMIATNGHTFRFAVSRDNRRWVDAGLNQGLPLDGKYLPPWDRGIRVALTAGGATGVFESLRIVPTGRTNTAARLRTKAW